MFSDLTDFVNISSCGSITNTSCLGNNDLKIDYEPPVYNHSEYYQALYSMFLQYALPKGSQAAEDNPEDEFRETFQLGGYYSVLLSGMLSYSIK